MLEAVYEGGKIIVRQLDNFTLLIKQAMQSLHSEHEWNPTTSCWAYPYSPGALMALADIASILRMRLSLDGPLAGQLKVLKQEFDEEQKTRLQIQTCLDDRKLPLADYPTLLAPPPWWHQKIVFHWAARVRALYVASKPGTGKTRGAVDVIRGKHAVGHIRQPQYIELPPRVSRAIGGRVLPARWGIKGGVLITCPRAVIGEWVDQLWRFQSIRAVPIVGRDAKTKRYRAGIPEWVHICGYDSLEAVEDNEYDGIIADEAHWIANADSNRSQRMLILRESAAWAMALSGTPFSNQLESLWAQFYWLDGGRTLGPSFAYYRKRYLSEKGWLVDQETDAETRVSRAIGRITLFMDMQTAFPDKGQKIQQVIRVPLTKEQGAYYEAVRQQAVAEIGAGEVHAAVGFSRIIKLLEIVQGFVIDDNGNTQQFSSAKLKALEEMLTGMGDLTDRKVIVWVAFTHDLQAIDAMLTRNKIKHMLFRGGMSDAQIATLRDKWNNDPDEAVMVGMIQIGIGVNMHAPTCVDAKGKPRRCSTTIFYGLNDKVSQVEQAMDRVYRGDQVETCLYRYILSDGLDLQDDTGAVLQTVDVRMYQMLQLKLKQALKVAEGTVEYARMLLGAS